MYFLQKMTLYSDPDQHWSLLLFLTMEEQTSPTSPHRLPHQQHSFDNQLQVPTETKWPLKDYE